MKSIRSTCSCCQARLAVWSAAAAGFDPDALCAGSVARVDQCRMIANRWEISLRALVPNEWSPSADSLQWFGTGSSEFYRNDDGPYGRTYRYQIVTNLLHFYGPHMHNMHTTPASWEERSSCSSLLWRDVSMIRHVKQWLNSSEKCFPGSLQIEATRLAETYLCVLTSDTATAVCAELKHQQ